MSGFGDRLAKFTPFKLQQKYRQLARQVRPDRAPTDAEFSTDKIPHQRLHGQGAPALPTAATSATVFLSIHSGSLQRPHPLSDEDSARCVQDAQILAVVLPCFCWNADQKSDF